MVERPRPGWLRVEAYDRIDTAKANTLQFCGKGPDDVRIMAGPNVWICDECVQPCWNAF